MLRIIIFVFLFVISCGNKTTNKHAGHTMATGDTPSGKITMLMHQPMIEQEIKQTGNPDLDFLVNMTPHHKGAILSAEEYLKSGKNSQGLSIASNIIASQKAEIEEFSGIIATLATNSSYAEALVAKYHADSKVILDKMTVEMSSVKLTENTDKDFLFSMIPHHKGAIEEAKNILNVSTNSKIIEIANRIISDQEKEIKEISNVIATL